MASPSPSPPLPYTATAAPPGVPPAAAAVVDRYVTCVMEYGSEWAVINDATPGDGTDVAASGVFVALLRVDFCLSAETPAAASDVLAAVTGHPTDAPLDPRLQAYTDAYRQWLAGDLVASAAAFETALTAAPADVFALKRAQLLYFLAGRPDDMLRVTTCDAVAAAQTGTPFYHGLLSFALEQTGAIDAALTHGHRAVELHATDLWATHGVAHALYFKGDVAGGVAWLRKSCATWRGCSFIVSHLWWHLALNHLDAGRFATVQQLYDDHVFAIDRSCMQDQMGALGLLLKWQLRQGVAGEWPTSSEASSPLQPGGPVRARVADAMAAAASKLTCHGDPLFDVLLAYGCGATGDDSAYDTLWQSACAHVDALADARKAVVATPWLRGMQAAHAFGKGDACAAADHLRSFATEPLDGVGGSGGAVTLASAPLGNSGEQRDVLDEMLVVCLCSRADTAATALATAKARQAARPGIPADVQLERAALCAMGDADGAATATRRAEELLAQHKAEVAAAEAGT